MQQLSKTCQVADHNSSEISYVCIYPLCLNSFLCSICLLGTIHKHNQSDNSHILDSSNFYEKMKNKFDQANSNIDIIQKVEQENQLSNIQKYGFNQIDDQTLNNLVMIYEQEYDADIYKQLEQNQKIEEQPLQQVENNQNQLYQKIIDAKYQTQQLEDTVDQAIYTGAISNDLKYIVSGGADKLLQIWDYQSNKNIEQILFDTFINICKFTEDSTLLYVGSGRYIYQFDVTNKFEEIYQQDIHLAIISKIYCISNTIVLTSSWDNTIIKTDFNSKQQLFKIQAHNDHINGLDYNMIRNIFVSGSKDKSIKLWNGNDGSLIIENFDSYNSLRQVQFIINNNQLISLDTIKDLIIWSINYQTKQLEQLQLIENSVSNISLVLQQQYIMAIVKKFIKVYSLEGKVVRQFYHEVDNFGYFNTTQLDSMKAVLILGRYQLLVSKIDMD